MGIRFNSLIVKDDDKIVKVNIWDTAGQDRFRSIIKLYLKNVDGIIIMYDVLSNNVTEELTEWINIVNSECENIYVMILMNKIDLKSSNEFKHEVKGREMCDYKNILFDRVSVKTFENMQGSLLSLLHTIRENPSNKDIREFTYRGEHINLLKKREKSQCC